MAFFGLFGSESSNRETYSGRESASDKAARKRRERHHREAAQADRDGWAWDAAERERHSRRGRRR
ncbi:hypothetical protein ACN20G_36825 (plasmid) [Streptomyces sp. BI20]|uniref:hypothetical protein n=1 Tax=Streptomyces sp. BI20 TaxID=3403460 RepID=UPI003C775CCC